MTLGVQNVTAIQFQLYNHRSCFGDPSHSVLVHVPSERVVSLYETLCEFAASQGLESRPLLFNTERHRPEHFWLLEEAQFEGKWVACVSSDESPAWLNYVRFLFERCATRACHETFRIWIFCTRVESYVALAPLSSPTSCVPMAEMERQVALHIAEARRPTRMKT